MRGPRRARVLSASIANQSSTSELELAAGRDSCAGGALQKMGGAASRAVRYREGVARAGGGGQEGQGAAEGKERACGGVLVRPGEIQPDHPQYYERHAQALASVKHLPECQRADQGRDCPAETNGYT